MLDEAFGSFRVVRAPTVKGVRASARSDMTSKGVEHPWIELVYSNLTNRCPMTEVCCTAQEELRGPPFVPSRVEPIGKTVHVLAGWASAQLAQLELAIDVILQHDNLLETERMTSPRRLSNGEEYAKQIVPARTAKP
jgi:hypothetical protein